jgi:hypothetical protein
LRLGLNSWIAKGEQFGLLTHIATTESVTLSVLLKSSLRFWKWNRRFGDGK